MNNAATDKQQTDFMQPVTFKKGLPGLDTLRSFTLYNLGEVPFFYYLQSTEDKGIGLILLDPFFAFPGYNLELGEDDRQELEAVRKEDLLVFTTVTVWSEQRLTTNLAAPIVINVRKKLGLQVIIPEKMDRMRTPLPLE